jgi:hypothetical protein
MRILTLVIVLLATLFGLQKWATYSKGTEVFLPYLVGIFILIVLVANFNKLKSWLKISSILILGSIGTSCNFIASDKIGVRVENYGHQPEDYNLVYGKFPMDWSASSWNLEYPGQSFGVSINPFTVSTKDGVTFTCDPSVLVELIRQDDACRKYAFKFKAYKGEGEFKAAIEQVILKECLDAVRFTIGSYVSDTILFNRTGFEIMIQTKLAKVLNETYGVNLSQFSLTLDPPQNLQQAINDRLLEQEKTKKTLASLENAKAEVELAKVQREKMLVQTAGYTDAFLRNKALDVYWALSQSNNKVFVIGDSKTLLIQ